MLRQLLAIGVLVVAGCATRPAPPPTAPVARLSWQPVTTLDNGEPLKDRTGYIVTFSEAGGALQSTIVTAPQAQLTLVPGKTYSFYVQAIGQAEGVGLKSITITKSY